jgi:hypothetical protein
LFFFSKQQKDGISTGIGIKDAGVDQRLDQGRTEAALLDQVLANTPEFGWIGFGKGQGRPERSG